MSSEEKQDFLNDAIEFVNDNSASVAIMAYLTPGNVTICHTGTFVEILGLLDYAKILMAEELRKANESE